MQMRATRRVAAALFAGAFLCPLIGNAQELSGRGRLGLEGGVLRYTSVTVSGDVTSNFGVVSVESTASTTGIGLANAGSGLGLGFAAGDSVLIGARVSIANQTLAYDDDLIPEASTTVVGIEGSPEFVLAGGAHPFLAPLLGFETQTSGSGSTESSSSLFVLGARLGMYAFVGDSASLDPAISFRYATGSADVGSTEFDASGFQVMLTFGVSAWFGGQKEPAVAAPPPEDYGSVGNGPSPEPRHASHDRSDGMQRMSLPLDDGQQLTLTWDVMEPDVFELGLFLGESAKPCNELTIDLAPPETIEATKTGRASVGSAERVFVQTQVDATLLDAIRRSDNDVHIDACGEELTLGAGDRHSVASFLREVTQARARAGLGKLRIKRRKRRKEPEPEPAEVEPPAGDAETTDDPADGNAPTAEEPSDVD